MGVSGGLNVFRRFREGWNRWPLVRSTSSRDGKGAVRFASTDEVLTVVYRPNLSVRDVCTEAAVKVNVSPVALDFFTLVTEDGSIYLNPNKTLTEAECNQTYCFKLSIKACHGEELWDFDPNTFEYYFHQCRQEFLRGTVGEFGENNNDFAKVIIYEIVYCAKQRNVSTKYVIENPNECGIIRLFQRGLFKNYPRRDIKTFLQENVPLHEYEKLSVKTIQVEYIRSLERAEDFFVHKLSFEKIYIIDNEVSNRKFEVQVSAEFGIKKRRTDTEKNLPEDIVQEFSEVEALELDPMKNTVTIIRKNSRPEILTASSPQVAYSLITLVEGYYRLMINQYKQLLRGPKRPENLLCHGPIMRSKAENLLQKGTKEDGSFLLRKSRSRYSSYVLSVYHAKEVKHFKIVRNTSVQPPLLQLENEQRKGFSSLFELIEHYKQSPDGLPVCLTTICPPKSEGLAALLDREIPTPAAPEFHLVDDCVKISLEDLVIESQALSKGEFGEVRNGSWWCSSAGGLMPVCSRALVKPVGREKLVEYRKAMSTFLELKNQHLILFHGIAENQKALIFVFEFAAEGPLDEYIRKESGKEKGITKGRVISYAAQIAEGMMFLHSKDCVHGRLSAHNVLVASEDCVKISDSGLLDLVKNKQSFYASRKENGFSYCWFSPLSLQSHSFVKKSDVWAFGVTVWEIFVMKKPFHCSLEERVLTREEVLSRYLQGQYLNPHRPNVPMKVQELIKRCCSAEPQDRPDFRDMVVNLWSPELVSEEEAEEGLLIPNINELEDWENPILPRESDLELQKHRADSEASNVDYSCLPGAPLPDDSSSSNNITLPGITYISNSASFNCTILRKESLSKTFSHPGLFTNDTLPLRDPVNALTPRKVSVTRASSCPPAIEASNEEPCEDSELTARQPERRQREVRFFEPPTSSSRNRIDSKLPCAPPLTQLEFEVFGSSAGISVDTNVEELDDSEDTSSGDDNEQQTTEAMAMQCLAGLVNRTLMPPTSFAGDVLEGTYESNIDNSNARWSELPANVATGHGDLSGAEINAHLSEYNSVDNKFETTTSFSQPCEAVHPIEDLRKLSSGSYVMLSRSSMSSDKFEHAEAKEPLSVAPNATDVSSALDASPYRSLREIEGRKVSSSSSVSSSSHDMEWSLSQRDTEQTNGSPGLCCTSSDGLLGSFSNLRPPNGVQSMDLPPLLYDTEDCSGREESSPVITNLQDSSDNEDASSRDDAESSLGNIFHSGFNRMATDNDGESALNLSLPAFTHLEFGLDPAEEQELVLEDDSQSHQNEVTPSQINVDETSLFMSLAGREEVDMDDHESRNYLLEESLPTSDMPCFEELLSNIKLDSVASTIATSECGTSVLENSADALDVDEQFEAHDGVDNEMILPCGPVRFPSGKVDFPNSTILMIEGGHENFEMKVFPLNNLSKECPKSTELLFFKDNQSQSQAISSNQLNDAFSEGGLSQDNDQEGDGDIVENVVPNPSPYSFKADEHGRLQEITRPLPEVPSEPKPANNRRLVARGYRPPPRPVEPEPEPETSLDCSSSSDGVWPSCETVDKIFRRKSTTGSSSPCEETPVVQLDMSKIPPHLKIPFEQLQLLKHLGQGQFGEVRHARMVYTDKWKNPKREDVAVKVLKRNASKQSSSDFVKEVENMVELASKPQCKYIIKLRGVCKDADERLMLITELASQGALRDYLPKNKDILGKRQLLEFCKQICEGMQYLEKNSLLHRDLAARNILVMSEDLVKISDFGLSRLQDYYKLQNIEDRLLPLKWYALESLAEKKFTTKSDVWSFGITMWEIFSYGGDPYSDIKAEELHAFLEKGNRLSCPEKCPQDIYKVMQTCWLKDSAKRPTFYYLHFNYLANCSSE